MNKVGVKEEKMDELDFIQQIMLRLFHTDKNEDGNC